MFLIKLDDFKIFKLLLLFDYKKSIFMGGKIHYFINNFEVPHCNTTENTTRVFVERIVINNVIHFKLFKSKTN